MLTLNNGLVKVVVLTSPAVLITPLVLLTTYACCSFFKVWLLSVANLQRVRHFSFLASACFSWKTLRSSDLLYSAAQYYTTKLTNLLWILSIISPFHTAIAIFSCLRSQYLSASFFCFNHIASILCNHKAKTNK